MRKESTQPEHDPRAIERAKQQVRDRIWALLERERAAKAPGRVVGKIPNSPAPRPPPINSRPYQRGRPPTC
jgi:hypothetical protein